MTSNLIKKELIRSALNDKEPFHGIDWFAFNEACKYKDIEHELLGRVSEEHVRMFYLLVSEAL